MGLTDEGVLGLTGEEEPLFVPGTGAGDDTVLLYVGGGGGGGAVLLLLSSPSSFAPESLGEATASFTSLLLSSLDSATSGLLGFCCSWGDSAGGVLTLEGGGGGGLVGETTGGETRSCSMSGGDVDNVKDSLSCGVVGADGRLRGGAGGSSEGGGEVGKGGGGESTFGGGSSGRGGGVGALGKGGGVGSFGGASSLKQTQESLVSSPAGGACSGPKRLSRSAMEGFLLERSASVEESGFSVEPAVGGVVGTFLGGRGGGVPVGKDLLKEELDSDKGSPQASDSDRTTSVFCSPKAVSNGGPNKAVVSSEIGD